MSAFWQGALSLYLVIGCALACVAAAPTWESMGRHRGASRWAFAVALTAYCLTWIIPTMIVLWRRRG